VALVESSLRPHLPHESAIGSRVHNFGMGRVRVCRTSIVSIPVLALIATVAGSVAVALAGLALAAAPARADGDPASDVLLGQNVFYPYSPPVSGSLQEALNGEAIAAVRTHFPIKIALIHSPLDLGAVPNLFGRPQQYADFLDQEISFQGRQPLLVVMPNGYGVEGLGTGTAAAAASLAKPAGSQSNDLARAAIGAVAALAAASGHQLRAGQNASAAGTGPGATSLVLVALGLAAVAAAAVPVALRRRQWSLHGRPTPSRRNDGSAVSRNARGLDTFVFGTSGGVVQPRVVVGLALIFGGVLWAVARGLESYGLNPFDIVYDLDQPPLLLALVGGWLLYRSRGR